MEFSEILTSVNVASADNGAEFTDPTRIKAVIQCLQDTPYQPLRAEGVAFVFAHRDYDARCATVLISCHIDHLYGHLWWTSSTDGAYCGTFDNSITLSALLLTMCRTTLHPQTLVTFTGDEEDDGRGAEEALAYLRSRSIEPELVICLDVTEEGYGKVHFTLENILPREEWPLSTKLHFANAEEYCQFLYRMLGETAFTIIEAEPDEAWVYDEDDINCFTLCLPAYCPDGMHADTGISIRQESIDPYMQALETICRQVCLYVANTSA